MANLLHFAVGAITLAKVVLGGRAPVYILAAAAVYVIFAIGFAAVVFGNPVKAEQSSVP